MQGLHITADLHDCACPQALLTQAESLAELCLQAVRAAQLQAVAQVSHTFPGSAGSPGGVTATVLLAESHLCVHTWPEQRAATLDVYVCNFGGDHSAQAEQLMDALCQHFQAGKTVLQRLQRGAVAEAPQPWSRRRQVE